ncbi:MAG: DNA-formamidopyrimidine glycosylase [Parachlamydia sp.]|jgi:formamidopyrimidine-DNA glycosylase|nr:DNA-formamidopyrimidine glycosylase [Parachlamydia sp.]
MPELPEVETIVSELRASKIIGLHVNKAAVFWNRSIAIPDPFDFCERISGQTIQEIRRRGKYIVFNLSRDILLVHLRMTGRFVFGSGDLINSHERVRLYLSDGRILHYLDQRKFGKWYLFEDTDEILPQIGLEPLEEGFTLQAFKSLLAGKKTKIKPFLMDQRHVAGLGNIYADEALWEAKIHPLRMASSLSDDEMEALHQAIMNVLKRGVENTGTSLGSARANYYSVSGKKGGNQYGLNVFRRDGQPCPRCEATLLKIVVSQRGTHFCPKCQI